MRRGKDRMRINRDDRYETDAERRIATGNRINGALAGLSRRQNVSVAGRLACTFGITYYYRTKWEKCTYFCNNLT